MLAAFHYQASMYDDIRPMDLGTHPNLHNLTRERERNEQLSNSELLKQVETLERQASQSREDAQKGLSRPTPRKNINAADFDSGHDAAIPLPTSYEVNKKSLMESSKLMQSVYDLTKRKKEPSLFLQEVAHLLSLLSAVAMSTLRNDVEGTESPLDKYTPGDPWPPVDPDALSVNVRREYNEHSRFWTVLEFLLGSNRSIQHRTLYNRARPFSVLGNVSDAEMFMLQSARGPEAKVGLCTMWIQEFLSREYLDGSTGKTPPPIISRLYQIISDGYLGYSQARKVAYIPFPFAHAQMTAIFVSVQTFMVPVLMYSYVNDTPLALLLNFFCVLSFVGLHEVAKELENPFQNAPNDIPLTTFQAQFNEALVTLYAGFHPDSWYDPQQEGKLGDDEPRKKLFMGLV
mmetsp:Transcript_974/g.1410  ORF Transcript_974/g.1410 Transcript_974/m.1410 type:complete len:402 (-) Transcript_974:1187-2392(-)